MTGPVVTTTGLQDETAAATALPDIQWAVAGGTADALTAAMPTTLTALFDGLIIGVRAAAANATATPTLNADGLGAKTIKKLGGSALVPGDINAAGHEGLYRYKLSDTHWELLNPTFGLN